MAEISQTFTTAGPALSDETDYVTTGHDGNAIVSVVSRVTTTASVQPQVQVVDTWFDFSSALTDVGTQQITGLPPGVAVRAGVSLTGSGSVVVALQS